MEHLPLPANPTLAPLKIPYLSSHLYDGSPLASYAARHGWELTKCGSKGTITHNGKPSTTDNAASFLQTWLYFGLLSATLGHMWRPEMQRLFLEAGPDGEKLLSTRCLEGIVVDWAGYVAEVPDGMRWKAKLRMWWKRYSRIVFSYIKSKCGIKTTEYRDEVQERYEQFRESMNLVQSVMLFARLAEPEALLTDQALALTALGIFLSTTWGRIYSSFYGEHPRQLASLEVGKRITDMFLHSHMLKMNWCPSDICRIMGKSSSSVIWYYANMQPPRADKDHESCPDEFCLRCQIGTTETYELAHRDKDCKCHLVEAELGDLRQVLEKGGIPVFSLNEDEMAKQTTLKVQNSAEVTFVAISHVWAEGLGNQNGNALQSCELTYLFDLIRQIPIPEAQTRSLWIDTICVPVKKCDSALNKLAMEKMKDTYTSAAEVLVLDAYVQSFMIKGASPLEAFVRVTNSSWMQRLWTLQEGRLAQRVYFQFRDGPVELGRIFDAIPLRSFPARADLAVSSEITMRYLASKYHTSKEVQEITNVLYEGILATRDAVTFRAVSYQPDEAFCLATLMDLDSGRITDAQVDKRMEALWEMLPRVPLSLVFSKAPSKLPTPGFHWAPSSFCGPLPKNQPEWWAGPDHLWKKMEAIPTQSGLLVQLPGLFLQPVNSGDVGWSNALDLSPNHAFQLSDGRWIGLCLEESWSQLAKDSPPEKSTERMALVLADSSLTEKVHQEFDESCVIDNDIPSRSHLNGVVARITRLENSCADSNRAVEIHVNGIQHVEVVELPPDVSIVFSAAVAAAHDLWERLAPAQQLTQEVVQVCIAVVTEIMRDVKVLDACRNQRRGAGEDDSDDEIMYMLAGMAHAVYLGGFNSAENVPEGCTWYID